MAQSMKVALMILLAVPAGVSFGQVAASEAPIRAIAADQVVSWNAGEGQAYARHLARTLVHKSLWDGHVRRVRFGKRHAEILDTFYKHTTKYHFIRRIRFVTDQSGRREGIAIDRAWNETSYRVMSLDCLASGGGESPAESPPRIEVNLQSSIVRSPTHGARH